MEDKCSYFEKVKASNVPEGKLMDVLILFKKHLEGCDAVTQKLFEIESLREITEDRRMKKMHEEIISEKKPVYDANKARRLYHDGKIGYHELSVMKQENIKEAIRKGMKEAMNVFGERCGYCFHFMDCDECPIFERNRVECFLLDSYLIMERCHDLNNFQVFKLAYNCWLKEIDFKIK